jgi:hypothetical protein
MRWLQPDGGTMTGYTYIRPRGILVCLVCRCHESIRIIRHEIR